MARKKTAIKKIKPREGLKLFVLFGFILAMSNALNAYIHSSFLSQYLGEKWVGAVITAAYVLAFFAVNNLATAINRLKIFKTATIVFIALVVCLFTFGATASAWLAIMAFIIYLAFLDLIWILMDVYVEYFSRDQVTGRIRGWYLTLINIAWLVSPITSGYLIKQGGYQILFLVSSFLTLLVLGGFVWGFKDLAVDHFKKYRFREAVKKIYRNKLINGIFVVSFLLNAFYCTMVVYAPLYLNKYVGFSWSDIGVMFTIMLSTFVFLTYPAGWLADKVLGEKEILSLGLLIMGLSCLVCAFLTAASFWLWTAVLFISRVGASLVAIMTDTYFFKRIDVQDGQLIHFFRNTTTLAYMVMPLVVTFFLVISGYQAVFLATGLIVLSGMYFSWNLKDTL